MGWGEQVGCCASSLPPAHYGAAQVSLCRSVPVSACLSRSEAAEPALLGLYKQGLWPNTGLVGFDKWRGAVTDKKHPGCPTWSLSRHAMTAQTYSTRSRHENTEDRAFDARCRTMSHSFQQCPNVAFLVQDSYRGAGPKPASCAPLGYTQVSSPPPPAFLTCLWLADIPANNLARHRPAPYETSV